MHTARCGEVDLGWGLTRTRQKVRGVPHGAICTCRSGKGTSTRWEPNSSISAGSPSVIEASTVSPPSATARRNLFTCTSSSRSNCRSASQAPPEGTRSGITMDTLGYD